MRHRLLLAVGVLCALGAGGCAIADRPRAAGPHAPSFRVPPHATAVHLERDGTGRYLLCLEYVARRPDRVTITPEIRSSR